MHLSAELRARMLALEPDDGPHVAKRRQQKSERLPRAWRRFAEKLGRLRARAENEPLIDRQPQRLNIAPGGASCAASSADRGSSTSLTAAMNLPSLARPRRSIMPRLVISRISSARSCGASRDWSARFKPDVRHSAGSLPCRRRRDRRSSPSPPCRLRAGRTRSRPCASRPFSISAMAIERLRVGEIIGRGDLSDHRHRRLVLDIAHRIGAVRQHLLGILGEEPDQLLASGTP